MEIFNVIAGIVTIASLIFSLWIYMDTRQKKNVEKVRYSGLLSRLSDFMNMADAIIYQANLIGTMSDRDETSKKELKHLTISLINTVNSLRNSLSQELLLRDKWEFGVPPEYIKIKSTKNNFTGNVQE